MLAGLAALAPATVVASQAEAKSTDENARAFREAVRKLLVALGKAESERRIAYWDYGSFSSRRSKRHTTSGRFVIDLKGEDNLTFLTAIMTGCVLCGHRKEEEIIGALQRKPKVSKSGTARRIRGDRNV
jgi:hypothetical protein